MNAVTFENLCQVICSDKTGTLTTNQMSVQRVLLVDKDNKIVEIEVEGITYEPKGRALRKGVQVTSADITALNELSKVSSLCNMASIAKSDGVCVFVCVCVCVCKGVDVFICVCAYI